MIIISDGSIIIDTKLDNNGLKDGLGKLGSIASKSLGAVTKATALMATGIVAATGAVAMLTKASIEQYAQYEQLVGGVETLFKDSSSQVMEYADNAYKTAGMSANEYMNTITGFSASLLQGLGGDTKKAAEIGNQAVIDMSDNANKMGTDMQSIQNAYAGFAKQNYTMLDNLRIGYGGTKSEMERLLADAQKLTGVHYDISNFSDIIQAIHAVQDNLGITGTTAKEAMSTIEGSLNMTKAAWTNMLTGMADDNSDFDKLVDNLVESVGAFGENILPRVEIALNGIGELINKLLPTIMDKVPEIIMSILPGMIDAGTNIITSLGNGIIEALPTIIDLGGQAIQSLISGLEENAPQIAQSATQIITSLSSGFINVLPQLLELGGTLAINLINGLASALPTLIPQITTAIGSLFANIDLSSITETLSNLMAGISEGLENAFPDLSGMLQPIQDSFQWIADNADAVTTGLVAIAGAIAGFEAYTIILAFVEAIKSGTLAVKALEIAQAALNVVMNANPIGIIISLIAAFAAAIIYLWNTNEGFRTAVINAWNIIKTTAISVWTGICTFFTTTIPNAFNKVVTAAKKVGTDVVNAFKSLPSKMLSIGKNIISGIINGIMGKATELYNKACEIANNIKNKIKSALDIHSPSRVMRDEVGVNIVKGIKVGIEKQLPELLTTAKNSGQQIADMFKGELNADTAQKYIDGISNVNGDFSFITKNIEQAQKALDEANSMKVNDNLSDSAKEQAEKVIDESKKAAQEVLDQANATKDKLTSLASAVSDALKEKITEEKTNALDAISDEINAIQERYNAESDAIDKSAEKRKASIQEKIDALDEEKEALSRLQEAQEANNNIAILEAKMTNNASIADKKAYELKIKNAKEALEAKKKEWAREDEKAALKEEQEEIEERAKAKREKLKADYEEEKENLEKKKEATEDYYNTLLTTEALNAQTRYLMLQGNNDNLVALLQSYNPLWQDAGQSLADSLLNGLNSKKESIQQAVEDIMSLTGKSSGQSEITWKYATPSGYATGTSYNSVAGLYNVDEKGFELSKNGGVAYVSKGAGILNHMQSLQAIDKIATEKVRANLGVFAEKLRNAVMMDQYRMSQLAFAGVNNSYGGNSYDQSSINFNVEHLHNDRNDSIENIANELGFYAKKKKRS